MDVNMSMYMHMSMHMSMHVLDISMCMYTHMYMDMYMSCTCLHMSCACHVHAMCMDMRGMRRANGGGVRLEGSCGLVCGKRSGMGSRSSGKGVGWG